MAREFTFIAGSGATVTTANNTDGTQSITITASGSVTAPSGSGVWFSSSGTLNGSAVTLTGDVSQGALSGSNVPLTVVGVDGHALPGLIAGYLNWTGAAWAYTMPVTSLTAGTGLTGGGTGAVTIALSVPVSVADGGTGQTSLNSSAVIVGNGAGAVGQVTGAAAGRVLTWHAVGNPSFDVVDLSGSGTALSGALTVPNGGTGLTSIDAHKVVVGNGTGNVNVVLPNTSGRVLTSQGPSADPVMLPVDLSGFATAVINGPTSTFAEHNSASSSLVLATGSYTTVVSVTAVIAVSGQVVVIQAGVEWFNASATSISYGIGVDSGTLTSTTHRCDNGTNGQGSGAVMYRATGLSVGSHTINLLAGFATTAGSVAGGSLLAMVQNG